MDSKEIPAEVWNSALVKVKEGQEYHRMDMIWAYLGSVRNPDGMLRYSKLANVAKLILVLPHSNAAEERVFSMVTKNKTKFRPSLQLDGTLSSIISIKLANLEPCHGYEPEKVVLEEAKKATRTYNLAHKN